MSFNYSIKKEKNSILIIRLSGRLIEKNQATELLDEIESKDGETLNLVIDLAELAYMNSTGLNVLITLLTRARKSGGEAIWANEPDIIKKLLVITKLNQIFVLAETVESALEQLSARKND
jgi:anti-sigma B factor antagonist